jgi:hypothetical protein
MTTRTTLRPTLVAFAALSALALSAAASRAADLSVMAKVGEREDRRISTPHPYAGTTAGQPTVTRWTVNYPGATYIKVHFERFDLAPGDRLDIVSLDGTEAYSFTGRGYKDFERDWWGNSVLGDTAILQLTSYGQGGYGFDIDYFARGIVPLTGDSLSGSESVCGTQDWQDVACYSGTNPTEYDRAKRSVVVLFNGFNNCTGVKVGCPNQFMTNEHCITSQADVNVTEVRFEYQRTGCNTGATVFSQGYLGSQFLKDDVVLDYCLFTAQNSSPAYQAAEIDNRLPPVGERIYISGHPLGGPKKLSISSASNAGGLCAVDVSPIQGNAPNTDIGYLCDTNNGSSGSPVFSGVTNKMVAIHHFGGCFNSGVRMDLIFPQISGLLTPCAPTTCGNGTIETGEDCDGSNLNGSTCQSLGFLGGTLSCSGACTYDTSACQAAISCADISGLRGRCQAGTLGVQTKLTNSTHTGQQVTVTVDGVPFNVTINGAKANMQTPASPGSHTIALVNPSGCVTPVTATCP